MTSAQPDFGAAHAVLQRQVEARLLPGVCAALWRDGELLDMSCTGWADIERGVALRPDHLHRAYSNTKLATSMLVLLLADQGCWALDDPVKAWLPAFGGVRVLRPGAARLDDTEPLEHDITLRHLLSHQAGFSHGVFDPGTPIYQAYAASGVRRPEVSLAGMAERLATLPLLFQPGRGWEYSMATDLLARLVEIVTGQCFADALTRRLLEPLGMADTGHVLRPHQVPRLAVLYGGDRLDPTRPGLQRLDDLPWPGAYLQPVARQGGASGLVTTLADMGALVRQLLPGRSTLLRPETLAELMRDQLGPEHCVQFLDRGPQPALGFGLAGAVTRGPFAQQPNTPAGELQWGGLAGTHWWVAPAAGIAGVLMTQRYWGFWDPFWFEYKQRVYEALG